MNRKQAGYILVGSGLSLAAIVGVAVYLQVAQAQQARAASSTQQVIVATADIGARTDISASVVELRTIPDELVFAGAATRVEDVVGKFSPEPILKGQLIDTQKIGAPSARNAPSFQIAPGEAMYVMPIAFAGVVFPIAQVNALRAGDRVDLLYTSTNAARGLPETRILLQDLHIQDIGSYADDGTLLPATADANSKTGGPSVDKSSIIFVVKVEQALVLKWLHDLAADDKSVTFDMVLRSPTEDQAADSSLVVNADYMLRTYNFSVPQASASPLPGH